LVSTVEVEVEGPEQATTSAMSPKMHTRRLTRRSIVTPFSLVELPALRRERPETEYLGGARER